jgi:hypothetical protein
MSVEATYIKYEGSRINVCFRGPVTDEGLDKIVAKATELGESLTPEEKRRWLPRLRKRKQPEIPVKIDAQDHIFHREKSVSVEYTGLNDDCYRLMEAVIQGTGMLKSTFEDYLLVKKRMGRLNADDSTYLKHSNDLDAAVAIEDYEKAAEIRDKMYFLREKAGHPVLDKVKNDTRSNSC